LRLHAPVPFVKRKCEQPVKLAEYTIAQGAELVLSPLVIHQYAFFLFISNHASFFLTFQSAVALG
jgi:hypothetical protein